MFEFHVRSKAFAEVMKKVSIAIPTGKQNGDGGCIRLVFYKSVNGQSLGLILAFNGSVQAASPVEIGDVVSEEEEVKIHVNGKKLLATAMAYAALDTILEFAIDKELVISNVGNKVTLPLGQETVALKPSTQKDILQEIDMEKNDFVNFITFATSCFGEEKGFKGMHCVGLRIEEGYKKICGISTNGTRCAYAEESRIKIIKKSEGKSTEEGGNLITTVIEGELLKNAVRNLTHDKVKVNISSKSICIKCGTDVVIILTQDIPFPYDGVMRVKTTNKSKGSWKAPLAKVFQALAIYEITMEGRGVDMEKSGDSQICFHGKDNQTNASVPCALQGEVCKILLDEKEFKAALSIFAKDQDIIIEHMQYDMPLSIRQSTEDENRIFLLPVVEE